MKVRELGDMEVEMFWDPMGAMYMQNVRLQENGGNHGSDEVTLGTSTGGKEIWVLKIGNTHFLVMGWDSKEQKRVNKDMRETKGKTFKKEMGVSNVKWFYIKKRQS